MPKTTSKSTALSLITQKLTAEQKLKDMEPPPFWTEKSPEHPRSPSTASEEESEKTEQNQKTDADEVSRELDMEAEEDEETEESTEEDSEASDSEKATKSEKTAKANAKVPEATDPIPLDDILKEAGVSIRERGIIKEDLSVWWPENLMRLSPADIIMKPQYCSITARQALYTIASQLSE